MARFLLNKTFMEKLDKHRRGFLWAGKKQSLLRGEVKKGV
jgi:hypothetical protein